MANIVEDRVLARIARDAVAWNGSTDAALLADVARGQVAVALRVLGIAATPEIARAVDEDIADIIADPGRLALARAAAQGRDVAPGDRLAA